MVHFHHHIAQFFDSLYGANIQYLLSECAWAGPTPLKEGLRRILELKKAWSSTL